VVLSFGTCCCRAPLRCLIFAPLHFVLGRPLQAKKEAQRFSGLTFRNEITLCCPLEQAKLCEMLLLPYTRKHSVHQFVFKHFNNSLGVFCAVVLGLMFARSRFLSVNKIDFVSCRRQLQQLTRFLLEKASLGDLERKKIWTSHTQQCSFQKAGYGFIHCGLKTFWS
jgi:hypothetical protein